MDSQITSSDWSRDSVSILINLYNGFNELSRSKGRSLNQDATTLDHHLGGIHVEEFLNHKIGSFCIGKSGLLNVLSKWEAAIVTSESGTTEDIIEVNLAIGGFLVVVSDTAGIRETEGLVEKEDIERAVARLNSADLILWLEDGEIPSKDRSVLSSLEMWNSSIPLWRILSKGDLVPNSLENTPKTFNLVISGQAGRGITDLISRLEKLLASDEVQQSMPLITRARYRSEVLAVQSSLSSFLNGLMDDSELRAEDLRQVATALGRLTGRIDVEELLGQIFGEFCFCKW